MSVFFVVLLWGFFSLEKIRDLQNTHAKELEKVKYEKEIDALKKQAVHASEMAGLQRDKDQAVTDGKLALLEEKLKNKPPPAVVQGPDWWLPTFGHWDPFFLYGGYYPAASVLLTPYHFRTLQGFLGGVHRFQLRYRGSRDGFAASTFHSICDNIGPTVVLIQARGYLFGGYTPSSWDSSSGYKNSSGDFLFSLTNPGGIGPLKLRITSPTYGIYCNSSYGPTFSGGHCIYIHPTASTSGDNNYSNLSSTYCDNNHGVNFFVGQRNFALSEIEVFQVN